MTQNNDLGFELPTAKRLTRKRWIVLGLALGLLLGAAVLVGLIPKLRAKQALIQSVEAAGSSAPLVEVIMAKAEAKVHAVSLPGSVRPLEETTVYPRASGYVTAWKVDIGDKVRQGDLLAEIDTPELNQQFEEARAELEKAKANLVQAEVNQQYAGIGLKRSEGLFAEGLTAAQELDSRKAQSEMGEANVSVGRASVNASQAKLRQLSQLKSYAKIHAPFSGTISSRSVERGALVSPATPLFRIAATQTLRVFVSVPQSLAPHVIKDAKAKVKVREFPGRVFEGVVARTSGSLDAVTRTLTTEVRVANEQGELLAGMYAEVELEVATPRQAVEVPATALVNDAAGMRVAIVDHDDKIRYLPIVIARDTGATIVVASGLNGGERVVRVASSSLVEGQKVTLSR